MDPIVLAAIAVTVVGVPIALGVRHWLDARRSGEMQAFGRTLGMRFEARDEQLPRSELRRLSLFLDGQDVSCLHVLRAAFEGGELLTFDLRLRLGTALTLLTHDSLVADAVMGVRKNRAPSYHNMTVVAFRRPGLRLQSFTARNGRVIEGALAPDALGCLRGLSGHVHAEGHGDCLAVYRFDGRVPIEELAAFLGKARRFAQTFSSTQSDAGVEVRAALPGRGVTPQRT